MNGVIYMYTSPSGKQYIGQTQHEDARKWAHGNGHSGTAIFGRAIKKYGYDAMQYRILHDNVSSRYALNCLEEIEIMSRKTLHPNGYNMMVGGYYTRYRHNAVPVVCVETGRMFETALHAIKQVNPTSKNASNILAVLNNTKRSAYGYHWCSPGCLPLSSELLLIKKRFRKVQCYETGELFDSLVDAAKSVGGDASRATNIRAVLDDAEKTAYGYHWVNPGVKHEILSRPSDKPQKRKAVFCIEGRTKYKSMSVAAKAVGLKTTAPIWRAIKNGKTAGGYHWKYADET